VGQNANFTVDAYPGHTFHCDRDPQSADQCTECNHL
jgi:hypothetical protein